MLKFYLYSFVGFFFFFFKFKTKIFEEKKKPMWDENKEHGNLDIKKKKVKSLFFWKKEKKKT